MAKTSRGNSVESSNSGSRAKTAELRRKSRFKEDICSLDYKDKSKEPPKVCFLSGREREILRGGCSRLDCSSNREHRDIGPGSYKVEPLTAAVNQLLNKVTSTAGYGGLASRAPRFKDHERRDSVPTQVTGLFHKQCFLHLSKVRVGKVAAPAPPFGSAVPRNTSVAEHRDTPGFYYDITKRDSDWRLCFAESFGGRTKLRPHVLIKCTPQNMDLCAQCDSKPLGDYWFHHSQVLCRPCYDAEWNKPTKYTRSQLQLFRKIRDCSHIHEHEGTMAAYPIMTMRDLWRQQVLECYFACYQGPRQIIDTEPRGQARQSRCKNRNIGRRKPKSSSIQVLFKHPKHQALVDLESSEF